MDREVTIKEIIFNLHGKDDGLNEVRYVYAESLSSKSKLSSQIESMTVGEAFVALRNLEDDNKIKFKHKEFCIINSEVEERIYL